MTPPAPIPGTIGSRIRVIFGDSGYQWLLLLDNDDGIGRWQSKYLKSIPHGLSKQIESFSRLGRDIKHVDFGLDNSWFVYGAKAGGSDGHRWWDGMDFELSDAVEENPPDCEVVLGSKDSLPSLCIIGGQKGYDYNNIPDGLLDKLKANKRRSGNVPMIRLFSDGNYFVNDDQGSQWDVPSVQLEEELRKNQKEEELSVAGDGTWIVIRADTFVCSTHIDTDLEARIKDFFRQQSERNQRRQREIDEFHDRQRAEDAKVVAERKRLEAEEQTARELQERRAREEKNRRKEEERAIELAEALSRATALEVKLLGKLTQEKESNDKLKTNLEAMQDHLYTMHDDLNSRTKSLRDSLETLSPALRPQWNLEEEKPSLKRQEKPQCVICHDNSPVRAVIPCGHLCLCDDCALTISQRRPYKRMCPLCRGSASSTLRIYS